MFGGFKIYIFPKGVMNLYLISLLDKLNFAATGKEAIIQNARFALSTILNSCPLDRNFGWDPPVDMPNEYAKTVFASKIVELLSNAAPELSIVDIEFKTDSNTGHLYPYVRVEFANG